MRVIVFGATGGTGRQLTEQALSQAHEVTAFVRHAGKLVVNHENLKIFQGDVFDSSAVEQAILGQDAALCSLGLPNQPFQGDYACGFSPARSFAVET